MAWHRRIWCFLRYGYICCLFDAEPAPGRWYPEEQGLKRSGDTVYRELPWENAEMTAAPSPGANRQEGYRCRDRTLGSSRQPCRLQTNGCHPKTEPYRPGHRPRHQRSDRRGSSQASELQLGIPRSGIRITAFPSPTRAYFCLGFSESQSTPFQIEGREPDR